MEDLDKVYAKRIAEEYSPKKERKVVQLKKLDEKAKRPAVIFAYTFGVFDALVLGLGMSFLMTEFGPSGSLGTVFGIIIGVIGLVFCGVNYPIYAKILNAGKQKYAYAIKELAEKIAEE